MVKHLALIMDGNRRWAKRAGLLPWFGHKQGLQAVERVIAFCCRRGIKHVSLYAFSLENFKRSSQELGYLFGLLASQAQSQIPYLVKEGIRVRFVGDRSQFPPQVLPVLNQLETETKAGNRLSLAILFCYGGQQEIVAAVQKLIEKTQGGQLEGSVSQEVLKEHMWTGAIPDPDLIVRTGGCKRLSNFFLFGAAYSELVFLDTLWPDLTEHELEQVLEEYEERTKNFGA